MDRSHRISRGAGALSRWSLRLSALAAVLAVSACTATTPKSSGTQPTPSATATATATPVPTPTPDVTPAPTPTAAPTAAPTATPVAKPTATAGKTSTPAGVVWKKLRWTAYAAPIKPLPTGANEDSRFALFGWSGGYVGFRGDWKTDADENILSASIVSATSTDGIHWHDGKSLTLPTLDIQVFKVVEGPSHGLLALGMAHDQDMCGGPMPVTALWQSNDGGGSWSAVDIHAAFGTDTVPEVEAGGAGYLAVGTDPKGVPVDLVSTDGFHWTRHPLTASVFKNAVVESQAAFAGGFVLAGSTSGGCADATTVSTIWWSQTGLSWQKVSLGTFKTSTDGGTYVYKINDQALIAVHTEMGLSGQADTEKAWTTRDGKTWTSCTLPSVADGVFRGNQVMSDGKRGLVLSWGSTTANGKPAPIWAFEPDLSLVSLTQSGDLPTGDDVYFSQAGVALGPAGIVLANTDASRFWVGVPTP